MKTNVNYWKLLLILAFITPFLAFTAEEEAEQLFKQSRYYEAFVLYRKIGERTVDQNEGAMKSSHAMALTRQFDNFKSYGNLREAKSTLKELIVLNPYDFHKPELAKMTFDEGFYFQRLARRQQSLQENNLMLDKAVDLYQESQQYGYDAKEVFMAIKQCDALKQPSMNISEAKIVEQEKTTPTEVRDTIRKENLIIKSRVE